MPTDTTSPTPVTQTVADTTQPVTDAIAPVTQTVGDTIQPVTDTVAPVIQTVGDTIQPVTDTVAPVTQTVGDAIQPVTDAIAPVTQPVTDTVAPIVETLQPVTDTLDPVLGPVDDTLQPILQPVTDVAQPVLDPVTDTIDPIVEPITNPVVPVIDSPIDPTTPPASDAGLPVTNGARSSQSATPGTVAGNAATGSTAPTSLRGFTTAISRPASAGLPPSFNAKDLTGVPALTTLAVDGLLAPTSSVLIAAGPASFSSGQPPRAPIDGASGAAPATTAGSTSSSSSGSNSRFDWPAASLPMGLAGLLAFGALILLTVTEASPRTWQFRPSTPPA